MYLLQSQTEEVTRNSETLVETRWVNHVMRKRIKVLIYSTNAVDTKVGGDLVQRQLASPIPTLYKNR